jgi:hypothetical protein
MRVLTYWWCRPGEEVFASTRMSAAYREALVAQGYEVFVGHADLPDAMVLDAKSVRVTMKRSLTPEPIVAAEESK